MEQPAEARRSTSDIVSRIMRRSGLVALTEGAGHAFMNPNDKEGFPARATADAQQRIGRFFAEKLRANIPNS